MRLWKSEMSILANQPCNVFAPLAQSFKIIAIAYNLNEIQIQLLPLQCALLSQ